MWIECKAIGWTFDESTGGTKYFFGNSGSVVGVSGFVVEFVVVITLVPNSVMVDSLMTTTEVAVVDIIVDTLVVVSGVVGDINWLYNTNKEL